MTDRADPAPDSPADPPGRRRLGRPILWRLLFYPLLLYTVVVVVLYALQTKLIFPGAETQGQREAQVVPPRGAELLQLTASGGQRVVALYGPALSDEGEPLADAKDRPTLLFFYGNGMCLAGMRDTFQDFRTLGVNVLVPDYLGYGMSGGEPGEASCYATADAAYDWLAERGVGGEKIIVGGWSLGAAVAADLAARRQVAGLLMLSPFTSMVEMAQGLYPFLPCNLLLAHRFDTREKLSRVDCPIVIGHGTLDDIVPWEMSDQLARVAKGSVFRFDVTGAHHNDFMLLGEAQVMAATRQLIERVHAGSVRAKSDQD